MNILYKNIGLASIVIMLITGCVSSISSFEVLKAEGEAVVTDAKKSAIQESDLTNVQYSDDFYVPVLQEQDQDKPGWFIDKAEGSFLDYTLEEIMRDELSPKGINIRYLDSLNRSKAFSLVHSGTIGGLLEKISFATKYSYEIEGDLLTWSKFKTSEFDVAFIAGQTDYLFGSKASTSGSTNNSSTGSNLIVTDSGFSDSDEFINFSTEGLSIWKDLEETINLLKSEEGKYVINQATSTILVKDYPDNVSAISDFIKRGNDKITQMIAVDIKIIEYSADEGDQRGVNWNAVKRDLATGGVFGFKSAFDSLIQDDLAPTLLGYTQETGKYAGSNVLINVLDKYGVVSDIKNRRIVSLNNQVSKVVKGGELAYLAQSGGTATANVGSQDNLMPGILRTGDTIFMLPNAVNGKMIIQLSTKLSRLQDLRKVESGGKSIETPETNNTDLFLKFAVNDGQTLLISGSSDNRSEYSENSTGGSILLGGELGGSKSSKETIILITPRLVHY